jgi:hypothetical protein
MLLYYIAIDKVIHINPMFSLSILSCNFRVKKHKTKFTDKQQAHNPFINLKSAKYQWKKKKRKMEKVTTSEESSWFSCQHTSPIHLNSAEHQRGKAHRKISIQTRKEKNSKIH